MNTDAIERIVLNLKKSPKYMSINEDFVRFVATEQLHRRKDLKEAIKFTRSKLHQVGAVYFDRRFEYQNWISDLSAAPKEDRKSLCLKIMSSHTSTRERLPFIEQFYQKIFEQLPQPETVLDIACGLNPLAIEWMNLGANVKYYAFDIYDDLAVFLNGYFRVQGVAGEAISQNVVLHPPTQRADVALMLKAIPCLEQVHKNAGAILLDSVPSNNLVISFPIKSLTGKNKGMLGNYNEYFQSLVEEKNWSISEIIFPTELIYIVRKQTKNAN